jgi:hypothetical protein
MTTSTQTQSNKDIFVSAILYSNKNVIADDNDYRTVQEFIDLQDEDFFEETDLDEIFEAYENFLDMM